MMNTTVHDNIDSIISVLASKVGNHIYSLKHTFLERRVNYRMRLLELEDFSDYMEYLTSDPDEVSLLCNSFSINVTKFFRDKQIWDSLSNEILPKLAHNETIAAWSCGCASGEEPYSVAILLEEFLKTRKIDYTIYATDISECALEHAKKGIYTTENLTNVDGGLRSTYFTKITVKDFEIVSKLKTKITFKKSNMLDSHNNKFDIIFCRNVLIYYDRNAHEKIFNFFYRSLKENGFLILGQDESMIGTKGNELFSHTNPRNRIYKKI